MMTLFFDLPFGNLKKLIFDSKRTPVAQPSKHHHQQNKLKELVDLNANEIKHSKAE
jgi:hypothetical protein